MLTEGIWVAVMKTPPELDEIVDAVLNYRPKNKAKNLRPKKRKKAK
jgi:hypothetical protein